jgi:hypothetical protein
MALLERRHCRCSRQTRATVTACAARNGRPTAKMTLLISTQEDSETTFVQCAS